MLTKNYERIKKPPGKSRSQTSVAKLIIRQGRVVQIYHVNATRYLFFVFSVLVHCRNDLADVASASCKLICTDPHQGFHQTESRSLLQSRTQTSCTREQQQQMPQSNISVLVYQRAWLPMQVASLPHLVAGTRVESPLISALEDVRLIQDSKTA